jgi:hypothetical protein
MQDVLELSWWIFRKSVVLVALLQGGEATSLLSIDYQEKTNFSPPVLSSILDRVPEMNINWAFDTSSGLYAKEGA